MQKMTPTDGQSLNVVDENITVLKKAFPEAFTEDGIDFEVLRQLLGDKVADGEEKYGLNWFGKKKARQIALTPSTGTLRPCPEESVEWSTTNHIAIRGDNLEVLKTLQKSYAGKIKLIYIDPPYNTGGDFIYPDKYKDTLDTYFRYTGQKEDDGFITTSNSESSGRYHTNWLNMMYSRLKVAKNLLSREGFIFISIDNHEVMNLKQICTEIFGEENFRNMIVVRRGVKNVQSQFETISNLSSGHEYILCYSLNADIRLPKLSHKVDGNQAGKWDTFWRGTDRPTMRYKLFGQTPDRGQWRWSKQRADEAINNYTTFINNYAGHMTLDDYYLEHLQSTNIKLNFVRLNEDNVVQYYVPPRDYKLISDNWMDVSIKGNAIGFDTEKHVDLLSRIIEWTTSDHDIVLDFFAGSGATGHAVWKVNQEDAGSRRFIMVQLPEKLEKNKEFDTIFDMTIKRLHLARQELRNVTSESQMDLGFKVFDLGSSNIVAWNPDKSNLENTLMAHSEHLVPGRSEQDVLYELLLKRGVELTAPIEEKEIAGKKVYSIGFGVLFACLDKKIQRDQIEELAHGIIDWHKELDPISDTQVVFRDSAFENDVTKANMTAILEQNDIKHVRSL